MAQKPNKVRAGPRLQPVAVRLTEAETAKLDTIRARLQGMSPPGVTTVTHSVTLRWVLNQAELTLAEINQPQGMGAQRRQKSPAPPANSTPGTGT